ncbi:MAG: HDOD domain-containing protein [Pseudomonadota bacterium]
MSTAPSVDSLVDDVTQLVSQPDIFHKLEEAIEDPNMSLDSVANLLAGDPDLTLRLLGIANSCLFGFPAKVESLDRAITLIGTRQLRDIVLVTVVVRNLRQLNVELIDMDQFWRHSVATGVLARAIAVKRGESNVERFYALGLLHDIGKILLYLKLPEVMIAVNEQMDSEFSSQFQAERSALGFDHAELGGALLESWDLAETLHCVIASHHAPMADQDWASDASILHVADVIANAMNWDECGAKLVPPMESGSWDCLDLCESELPEIVERGHEQYKDAVQLMLN